MLKPPLLTTKPRLKIEKNVVDLQTDNTVTIEISIYL